VHTQQQLLGRYGRFDDVEPVEDAELGGQVERQPDPVRGHRMPRPEVVGEERIGEVQPRAPGHAASL